VSIFAKKPGRPRKGAVNQKTNEDERLERRKKHEREKLYKDIKKMYKRLEN